MKLTFKKKIYRTYELRDDVVQAAVKRLGIVGFVDMLLDSDEFVPYETEWELLSTDREELKKHEKS